MSNSYKCIALLCLFVGLGFIALWGGFEGQQLVAENPTSAMAWSSMQPAKSMQPQFRGMTTPVRSAMDTLKAYGVAPSPMEKLALTAIDAVNRGHGLRHVATMASRMDRNIQVKMASAESAVVEKAKMLPGILAPTGFFDPVGFTSMIDEQTTLLFWREVELKHGRVGMLASLGILVGEKFHPLFGGIDFPAALAFQKAEFNGFWPAMVIACGVIEAVGNPNSPFEQFSGYRVKEGWKIGDTVIGDLGYDPLGLKPEDPQEFLDIQNKELNNGRLAMLAAAGMIAQELVTGEKIF